MPELHARMGTPWKTSEMSSDVLRTTTTNRERFGFDADSSKLVVANRV
jgi:hypothetical protein